MLAASPRETRFWFAVDDLLHHFKHWQTVAGIQRVGAEIIQEALSVEPTQTGLAKISHPRGCFAPLHDPPALIAGPLSLPRQIASHRPSIEPGDYVVELGGYWPRWSFGRAARHAHRHGLRLAIMVHDLLPLTHPLFFERAQATGFAGRLAGLRHLVDVFLVSSESVRVQLTNYLESNGIPAEKVKRIEFGTGLRPRAERVPLPWQGPYVLCVGTLEIRKNHLLLLKVWEHLIAKHGAGILPRLVFLGRKGWKSKELLQELHRIRADGGIVWHEQAEDALLASAYQGCLFTIYPSLAEGWGLPVAESLSYGKLCLCSGTTSLPEVGGRFADYFDPLDFASACRSIERAILDVDYLRARNADIAANYKPSSWRRTARQLIGCLRQPASLPD